jgi:hypothetical protein
VRELRLASPPFALHSGAKELFEKLLNRDR